MFKKLNLFSKIEMKLLSAISVKDGELYERQVAKEAGVSVGSANAILRRFSGIGLVRKTKKGRMTFYRRNDDSPVVRQFKVFMTINRLAPLLEKMAPMSRRIVLFGSCAEGRNGEKNDIDIFVLSKEKERIRRMADDYPEVQVIVLDTAEYIALQEKDKPLYARIKKGVELLGEGYG